jgi:hypothetical protein
VEKERDKTRGTEREGMWGGGLLRGKVIFFTGNLRDEREAERKKREEKGRYNRKIYNIQLNAARHNDTQHNNK